MSYRHTRTVYLYLLAFAIAGVTPFLLLPLLTKHLSPSDYGEVTSFIIWTTLLSNIAGLCAHGFISVRFFKIDAGQFRTLVSSSIATVALVHLLTVILVFVSFDVVNNILELPIRYALFAVISSFFLSVNLLLLSVFQVANKPELYLRVRFLQSLVELILCVTLIYMFFADSGARIYSYALALLASVTLGVFYARRLGYIGVSSNLIDSMALLRFSGPLMPHIVAGTIISNLDRLVVSTRLGSESLGVYMVAMQIGMAMIIIIDPLNKALMPWLFEQLNKDCCDIRRMVVKRTYMLFVVLVVAGSLLYLMADYLFDKIIDEKFSSARSLIPWFISGFVVQGMYYTQVNYLFYAERTSRLSLITMSVAIAGTFVSWEMTSIYALEGAGASFLINNAILFLLVWAVSSRTVSMPWSLRK